MDKENVALQVYVIMDMGTREESQDFIGQDPGLYCITICFRQQVSSVIVYEVLPQIFSKVQSAICNTQSI